MVKIVVNNNHGEGVYLKIPVKKLLLLLFLVVMTIASLPLFYFGLWFLATYFDNTHPKYKFSRDVTISNEMRVPMADTNLPYGDWLLWNTAIKITVREDETYIICFKNECETHNAEVFIEPDRNYRRVTLKNFFKTKAGQKYLTWDYYHRYRPKVSDVEPVNFSFESKRCHLPPSGWCNHNFKLRATIRNTFVYQNQDELEQ